MSFDIGQALFSSLQLRPEGLAAATLARCATVTAALMPTASIDDDVVRVVKTRLHCFL